MKSDFGVVYHLWSYAGEPDELLDRLIGEVGIDHLTAAVVSGPVQQFRIAPPKPPNLFATNGGWHYPPAPDPYRGTPARPRTARWFGKRDVLARVAAVCAKRGVELVCRIDLRACRPLVDHEPHLAMRNAWGDATPGAGVCVLNPDARELLLATARDLQRYEPVAFQAVDWAADLPVDRAQPRPLDHTPAARALLDLCFCPACRQVALAAGVDPDQVARSVRQHVLAAVTEPVGAVRERLERDEMLAAYVTARHAAAARWRREVAARHTQQRWLHVCDMPAPVLPWDGLDAPDEGGWIPIRHAPPSVPATPAGSAPPGGLILPVWRPSVTQPDQLVRATAEAASHVAGPIEFDGVEEAPPEVVDWLRQALRYARR